MALINEVKIICDRLAPLGWASLLKKVTREALNIKQGSPAKLETALTAQVASIDHTIPGFEDFNPAGDRGVVAGKPSESLLYHALASPLVTRDDEGRTLRGFASPAELDVLENYIFSLVSVSLQEFIRQQGGASKVAVVVFASEYRPASSTVDGRHADLTFSRTGISRIGTDRPLYRPETRGFWPEDEDNVHNVRVVPTRFSVWLAVKKKGRDVRISPILDNAQAQQADEPTRDFWVPVHKLFPGKQCLRGLDLTQRFNAKLFNLKIQRIHKAIKTTPLPTGFPYVIADTDLADWSTSPELGPGWLVPTVHESLVQPAIVDGNPITYKVNPKLVDVFAAVELPGKTFNNMEIHPAPSYVHGRTKVQNGQMHNLNDEPDVVEAMKAEKYDALHYVDFTGEGWVEISIPELAADKIDSQPAYALISAPDFFPASGQFELSEWSRSKEIPKQFQGEMLWNVPPTPLSETRLPGNLQLLNTPFLASDTTITAVVAMGSPAAISRIWPTQPHVMRASCLPDDAAGVFAPGWDAGVDRLPGVRGVAHLAGYGLGSPFPEDAKLCAALSTFWPAVAPDVFRTFATPIGNTSGTIAPLTDEEIGQSGSVPWDGIAGPRVVQENGQRFVELARFLHADYVRQAVQNRFSVRLLSRIGVKEYQARILAISRVYSVVAGLGSISLIREKVLALSFRAVSSGDPELQKAQTEAGTILDGAVYRVELCANVLQTEGKVVPGNPRLQRFPLQDLRFFFVSATFELVLTRRENDLQWAAAHSES